MGLAWNVRGDGEPIPDALLSSHFENQAMAMVDGDQAVEIVPSESHVGAQARLQDRVFEEQAAPDKPF